MKISSRFAAALAVVTVIAAAAPAFPAETPVEMGELYRTEDWRTEKHVPVIDCPDTFVAGEPTTVTVTVGKELAHPNTTGHHIRWIRLYFVPADSSVPYEVGNFELAAHGESVLGPDTSTVLTDPRITVDVRTGVAGTFYATAYCNIHGLWESSKAIAVEK